MHRPLAAVAVLILTMMVPSAASAELLRVDLTVHGMDCATCAHGVRLGILKVDGVESSEVSLERAAAVIRLRPGNRVRLPQFRKIVKDNGFVPKEAVVTAAGTLVDRGGQPALAVANTDEVWLITRDPGGDPARAAAHAEVVKRLKAMAGNRVEVTGVVAPPAGDAPEQIMIRSLANRAER
jgi:copper chaperone CopZ